MENSIFQPTKRSRNKPKPIPTADQITSYQPTTGFHDVKWARLRGR
ncbi:NinE family protein [Martelella alba]|nr:NinE family protein [Martelella alba]